MQGSASMELAPSPGSLARQALLLLVLNCHRHALCHPCVPCSHQPWGAITHLNRSRNTMAKAALTATHTPEAHDDDLSIIARQDQDQVPCP